MDATYLWRWEPVESLTVRETDTVAPSLGRLGEWAPRTPTRWIITLVLAPFTRTYSLRCENIDLPGATVTSHYESRSLAHARDRAEQLARLLAEQRRDGRWVLTLADGTLTEPDGCWRRHAVRAAPVQ